MIITYFCIKLNGIKNNVRLVEFFCHKPLNQGSIVQRGTAVICCKCNCVRIAFSHSLRLKESVEVALPTICRLLLCTKWMILLHISISITSFSCSLIHPEINVSSSIQFTWNAEHHLCHLGQKVHVFFASLHVSFYTLLKYTAIFQIIVLTSGFHIVCFLWGIPFKRINKLTWSNLLPLHLLVVAR